MQNPNAKLRESQVSTTGTADSFRRENRLFSKVSFHSQKFCAGEDEEKQVNCGDFYL